MLKSSTRAKRWLGCVVLLAAGCVEEELDADDPEVVEERDGPLLMAYPFDGGEMREGLIPGPNGELVEGEYRVLGDKAIVDGDVVYDLETIEAFDDDQFRSAYHSSVDRKWKGGVIHFEIANGFALADFNRINAAINAWNATTVIRLVPRNGEADFVRFVPGVMNSGCFATGIGRIGGQRTINLEYNATNSCAGAEQHEIGHVAGLYHEQTRQDRNTYVTYNSQNVDTATFGDNALAQFNKYAVGTGVDYGPYDWSSMMHYGGNAFALPATQTLVPINKPAGVPMGSSVMSDHDIRGVSAMYGARGTATVEIVVDSNGKCFDIPSSSNASGVVPQEYTCHGGQNQRWMFFKQSNGAFVIRNEASARCLDLAQTASATWVQQYACHDGQNQQWRVLHAAGTTDDSGWTRLQSVRDSSRCLEIDANGSVRAGYCSSNAVKSYFQLYGHPRTRAVHMVKQQGGWCTDVPWASVNAGVAVQKYPCKAFNDENQSWEFEPTGDGRHYQIRSVNSGLCLRQDNDHYNGYVRQQVCNANENHARWRLNMMTDGSFQIKPRYSWSGRDCLRDSGNAYYQRAAFGCVSGDSATYWYVE